MSSPSLKAPAARTGKCSNFARCFLASSGELIAVPDGAPFVCPECTLPLLEASASGRKPIAIPVLILGGISLLVTMASVAVYFEVKHFKQAQATGQIGSSFEQAELAAEHGELMPARHLPAPGSSPEADSGVELESSNFGLQDPLNQRAKAEVLQRIGLNATISSSEKAKLASIFNQAKQMGRIIAIPFPAGHVALSPDDADQLRGVLGSAALQRYLKNPGCVFVILGFSDLRGDEAASLSVAGQRAQSVLSALQESGAVPNEMHAVGIGVSTVYGDDRDAERNRLVEIWAVLP